MKIGMVSDGLAHLGFAELLEVAQQLGLDCIEFATGNWSGAPHLDLDALLGSAERRAEFLQAVADHDLTISALTCNGNSLHPGDSGRDHDAVVRKTMRLATELSVDRVVMMSGCPGAPGDQHPNWITVAWPPEATEILSWQWSDVIEPYWRELAAFARDTGIARICIEMHGFQNVYNVETLFRLRDIAGDIVGVNFDPSHLMWMGADPIASIYALDECIYHVHAKDTLIEARNVALNNLLETKTVDRARERSWNYVTLGYGHGESFWREFCMALRRVGYDDVLSIEHEDTTMAPREGIEKSIELLRRVAVFEN